MRASGRYRTIGDVLNWLDPLHNNGYQFWSGIGSGSPILAAGLVWWHHHNCHVRRCWRLSWHPHPDHGHPVCRRHHPDGKGDLRPVSAKRPELSG